ANVKWRETINQPCLHSGTRIGSRCATPAKEPMNNHDEIQPAGLADKAEQIRNEIGVVTPSARKRYFEKFLLAALGSIPWVGGFISTMATLKTEAGDLRADDLRTQCHRDDRRALHLGNVIQIGRASCRERVKDAASACG